MVSSSRVPCKYRAASRALSPTRPGLVRDREQRFPGVVLAVVEFVGQLRLGRRQFARMSLCPRRQCCPNPLGLSVDYSPPKALDSLGARLAVQSDRMLRFATVSGNAPVSIPMSILGQ